MSHSYQYVLNVVLSKCVGYFLYQPINYIPCIFSLATRQCFLEFSSPFLVWHELNVLFKKLLTIVHTYKQCKLIAMWCHDKFYKVNIITSTTKLFSSCTLLLFCIIITILILLVFQIQLVVITIKMTLADYHIRIVLFCFSCFFWIFCHSTWQHNVTCSNR